MSVGSPLDVPLLRTFRSRSFRTLLALVALLAGLVLNYLYVAGLGGREIGLHADFDAYYLAARAMLDGGLPYTAKQLAAPIDAVCIDCYLYPPFLAQLISPLALLSADAARAVWHVLLTGAAIASVWIAADVGGARRSLERLLWTLAAITLFMPAVKGEWVGNVSSIVALGVALTALGGVVAGVTVALGILVKLVAGAFLPAVFLEGRPARLSLVATLAGVGGIFFLLAPQAWLEYLTVLPNLLAGSGDVHWNLAPAAMAERAGLGEAAVGLIRAATVVGGIVAIAFSAWVARSHGGMPAAVVLGTVGLLFIPGTLWDHYLTVLLPISAMAFSRAGATSRTTLVLAMSVITFASIEYSPPVIVGASGVVLAIAAWVLWPRGGEHP